MKLEDTHDLGKGAIKHPFDILKRNVAFMHVNVNHSFVGVMHG